MLVYRHNYVMSLHCPCVINYRSMACTVIIVIMLLYLMIIIILCIIAMSVSQMYALLFTFQLCIEYIGMLEL